MARACKARSGRFLFGLPVPLPCVREPRAYGPRVNRRLFIAVAASSFVAMCGRPPPSSVPFDEARASAPIGELPDGLYKVLAFPAPPGPPSLLYDPRRADASSSALPSWIHLDVTDYVPLVLGAPPTALVEPDGRLRLAVSLTREHVDTLAAFTRRNVGGRAAIVLDGDVVTVHKQRSVITDGRMQITRCTDRACERLLTRLVGDYDAG